MKIFTFVFMGGFVVLWILWLCAPKVKKQIVEILALFLKSAGWTGIGFIILIFLIYGTDSVKVAKFTLLGFLASVVILGMGHAFAEEVSTLKEKICKYLSANHWTEFGLIKDTFTDKYGNSYPDEQIIHTINQLEAEGKVFLFNSFVVNRN